MALLPGSPCYPAWRVLTARWRDCAMAWRALGIPLSLPALAASAPSGALAYGADVSPVVLAAVGLYGAGGLLFLGAGAGSALGLLASGGGSVDCVGGAEFGVGVALSVIGRITASSAAGCVAALLSEASGGALRQTVTPPARMSLGRLTWRI